MTTTPHGLQFEMMRPKLKRRKKATTMMQMRHHWEEAVMPSLITMELQSFQKPQHTHDDWDHGKWHERWRGVGREGRPGA